ncbi:MAG: hypothetical protein V1826_01695, partial [bacterium]
PDFRVGALQFWGKINLEVGECASLVLCRLTAETVSQVHGLESRILDLYLRENPKSLTLLTQLKFEVM